MSAFHSILRPWEQRPLPPSFFERDPRSVAADLLGCVVASTASGAYTAGRIVETEAYLGADDPGSHAATKGITARNAVMYGPAGHAYVYFTYGNHHMLNFVCERDGVAGAALVRAIEPLDGVEVMTGRRSGRPLSQLTDGPGKLTAALGITLADNGVALGEGAIRVYAGERRAGESMGVSGRIGLREGSDLDYRYYLVGNPFVSKARTGPLPPTTRGARSRPRKEQP